MKIDVVKIVGRGNPLARKVADVRFIRSLVDYLEGEEPEHGQFYAKARQLYMDTYRRRCRTHLCYFPEVMLG